METNSFNLEKLNLKLLKCSKTCQHKKHDTPTIPPESRQKLPPVIFSEKALNKWGHGMGNLMLYNNTFTISEELELFDESIRLVEDFWKFQEENHEIVIPDRNLFKTKVPELYHYKLWG